MQDGKWLSGTELKGKIVTLIPLQLEHASALVEAAMMVNFGTYGIQKYQVKRL